MNVRHLTARDYLRQPWKNGGGTTTELARLDEGRRWLWRVSIAEVERSGPFSHFVGYDRVITLLEGDGMTLRVDGALEHALQRHRPFGFDGGAATEATLVGGPVKDLNLIVDRERAHGGITIRSSDASFLVGSPWMLVVVLEGEASLVCEGQDHRLRRGEALRLDDAQDRLCHVRALKGGTVLAEIRVDRK